MYSIQNKVVYYNKEPVFEAPAEIRYSTPYKEDLIINFFVPIEDRNQFYEYDVYRNVVCINGVGEMIWRIQQLPRTETLPFRPRFETVGFEEDGALWAYDGGGWENLIDPETGKILDREFTK